LAWQLKALGSPSLLLKAFLSRSLLQGATALDKGRFLALGTWQQEDVAKFFTFV
jgi:hypothetical protein